MDDKVIAKIRKLLAVANGSAAGGEHERDTAMRMALGLLAKYNLDMADLSEPQEIRGKDNTLELHATPWMRWVGDSVAKLFFCFCYTSTSYGKTNRRRYSFIGLRSNVETAKAITEYVVRSIEREGTRRMKEGGHSAAWANSFRKGAALRIGSRCTALRKQAELEQAPVSGERGIVLASVYKQNELANQKWLDDMGIEVNFMPDRTQDPLQSGLRAGAEFGDKINLHRQLDADGKQQDALRLK
jgi:hypothetical protein